MAEPTNDRSASRSDYRLLLVALAILFVIDVILFGAEVLTARGFPLDDAWIHQVIGRNLALHGVPSFIPGEAPAGSTSTLWPAIVALNHLFLAGVEPYVFLLVFNLLMGIVASRIMLKSVSRFSAARKGFLYRGRAVQ